MEDEYILRESKVTFSNPIGLYLDLDKFNGVGVKSFHITIKNEEYVFSIEQIKRFLDYIKDGFDEK